MSKWSDQEAVGDTDRDSGMLHAQEEWEYSLLGEYLLMVIRSVIYSSFGRLDPYFKIKN